MKSINKVMVIYMIVFAVLMAIFKPAKADQMTQYDASTQIYLQDTSSEECDSKNATGTAYALDTAEFKKAVGCWANYGEIYEIQVSPEPKVYIHYYLNSHRFEVQ